MRAELGAAAALATTSGTFSTYLSDLTRNGLAERHGERITGDERADPRLRCLTGSLSLI